MDEYVIHPSLAVSDKQNIDLRDPMEQHDDVEVLIVDSDREDDSSSYASNSTAVYDHEAFETFQNKVLALAPELQVKFQDVERLGGGSYNRIIALTMRSPPSEAGIPETTRAILRIPRLGEAESLDDEVTEHAMISGKPAEEDARPAAFQIKKSIPGGRETGVTQETESPYVWFRNAFSNAAQPNPQPDYLEILDEASVLNLLVRSGIHVPKVLAFDITRNNALKFPYSLHTRLPGTNLSYIWEDMSTDDKMIIAGELAELLASLDKIRFQESGRVLHDESTAIAHLPLDLVKRSEIGEQVVVRGFFRGPELFDARERPSAPTTSSLYDLLSTHIDDQIQYNKFKRPNDSDSNFPKLHAVLEDMKDMGWFSSDDGSTEFSIIHHWDFEPRNIMVEQTEHADGSFSWHVTGLIDWDDAHCLPPVLTRRPPLWLWDFSDDNLLPSAVQKYYDTDYDMMPLEYYREVNPDHLTAEDAKIKKRFEEVMADKIYSPRYGARAMEVYQDDTYGRGRWLRRVWRFAKEGIFSEPNHNDRFEQLLKEWTEFKETGQVSHSTVFGSEDDALSSATDSITSGEQRVVFQSPIVGTAMDTVASEDAPKEITEPTPERDVDSTQSPHEIVETSPPQQHKAHWRTRMSDLLSSFGCITM
ncbi:hypothetical protein KCU95_g1092, partial [Aureobasidium melanogenum]